MKKTLLAFAIIATLLGSTAQAQYTYEDVTLPGKMTVENKSLDLNGGGLREKYFLDLYVGGLYLTNKTTDANQIINADEPMAIKLHIISGLIDSEKMIEAVDEGMEKSTNGNPEQFSKEIAEFKKTFMEEIKLNDVYDIAYVPGTGVVIYKNGAKSNTIQGLEFKKAVFGIWLCDDPADEDLKEGMLKG